MNIFFNNKNENENNQKNNKDYIHLMENKEKLNVILKETAIILDGKIKNISNPDKKFKKKHKRIFSMQTFSKEKENFLISSRIKNIDEFLPGNSEEYKTNQKCLICFDKEPDSVIMNCGHGGNFFFEIYLQKKTN